MAGPTDMELADLGLTVSVDIECIGGLLRALPAVEQFEELEPQFLVERLASVQAVVAQALAVEAGGPAKRLELILAVAVEEFVEGESGGCAAATALAVTGAVGVQALADAATPSCSTNGKNRSARKRRQEALAPEGDAGCDEPPLAWKCRLKVHLARCFPGSEAVKVFTDVHRVAPIERSMSLRPGTLMPSGPGYVWLAHAATELVIAASGAGPGGCMY